MSVSKRLPVTAWIVQRLRIVWSRFAWLFLITEAAFVASSPAGRSVKYGLFIVGAVMPLGSLIWALLIWHGNRILKHPPGQGLTTDQ